MYALKTNRVVSSYRTEAPGLQPDPLFLRFIEDELLPEIGVDPDTFWGGLADIAQELSPENRRLLQVRDEMQQKIDAWHKARTGQEWNFSEYQGFLQDIGYLRKQGEPFEIATQGVDAEMATTAGPQLVVPVSNARFALNAANARWGSLYDALYGTDVIEQGSEQSAAGYDPQRGAEVIRYATDFLDRVIPLDAASHADVVSYAVEIPWRYAKCFATLKDGRKVGLQDCRKFAGWSRDGQRTSYLFHNNGLHFELQTDPEHAVGQNAPGNVSDVVLEAAVTTIQDCEDSVAAVDAADKVNVYRNWFGLMCGTLSATFEKNGAQQTRRLQDDRKFIAPDGEQLVLSGRSLLLVRNVGHLMTTDTVLDADGNEIFEGILDAVVTTACAIANFNGTGQLPNSSEDSIYIVKPKMHGPDEAAFADKLFSRVEALFDLPCNTIKIGVMDEERRTTANLQECIRAVRNRVVFINTGFLDRTGDEIHTSMHAGPMLPKDAIKAEGWIDAYEDLNVDVGIRCGLPGKAQIGKGMWARPDEMREMMANKQAHPEAGASCAWVPSPTAATLHAMHYHDVDVWERQEQLADRASIDIEKLLTPPLCNEEMPSVEVIQNELDSSVQSILGYVVRWVDHGNGCSKVPDINNIGLMEDRATLRISSQLIANWLLHGICSKEQVLQSLQKMARVVDSQNAGDSAYENMSENYGSNVAFAAACDLIFQGAVQPNGYTEPLLHQRRKQVKRRVQVTDRGQQLN